MIDVALPYLDPAPDPVEGSGRATYASGPILSVVVEPGAETPPRSGFYLCDITAEYDFEKTNTPEEVSKTWGQILEAFGNGTNGQSPLRNRLASGKLIIPNGVNSVMNDGRIEQGNNDLKQFTFSAHLGILPPN